MADRRRARVATGGAMAAARLIEADRVFRLAGSNDPALQLLLDHIGPAVTSVSARGSFWALRMLSRGQADGAAIQLRRGSNRKADERRRPARTGIGRAPADACDHGEVAAGASSNGSVAVAAGLAVAALARRVYTAPSAGPGLTVAFDLDSGATVGTWELTGSLAARGG